MFDLTISKEELLPRLLMVFGAVDKKQSLLLLSHFLFIIKDNLLHIIATDLEMEIVAKIPVESAVDACLTVPAKKCIDIIRSLDCDSLRLYQKDQIVIIKALRSQFKLTTLPFEKFPRSESESIEVNFTIPKEQLLYLLLSTHFAMSSQDVRAYLQGLLFEIDSSGIHCVTTDGHRMAICRYVKAMNISLQRFLLPRKSVQEMLRLLQSLEEEEICIDAGKSHFRINTQGYIFTSRLVEARFPPYGKAIPVGNDKIILADTAVLRRALQRIIILSNENRAVIMHLQPTVLTLVAHNQEQEEATETIEAVIEGEELTIGVNAGYLLDVLSVIQEDKVRISLSTADESILVEAIESSYRYIIMPMKL